MTDAEPNIHDHPWLVTESIVPDINGLGCVMLPVQFRDGLLQNGYDIGIISPDDLYVAANPAHFWIAGDVSADAHITLLYGLLTPAFEQEQNIDRLFTEWKRPAWLPITGFESFPSPMDDENYACIVARIGDRDGLLSQARGLLSYLPHVDTFPTWKTHATVAYVKADAGERWLEYLGTRNGLVVEVPATNGTRSGLDLGSAH